MKKKKKKNNDFAAALVNLMFAITRILVILLMRITLLIYDVITFITSGYGKKSGNHVIKTLFDRGFYGEFQLYRKVIRVFGKASVFTNVYLDSQKTETTEVDVIAISDKGVYVFEMKNYGGYIYGSEKDTHWTQAFHKRSKFRFYNPLRQNYAHTKAVEAYLNLEPKAIYPVIVFSNRSIFSKLNLSDRSHVYRFKEAMRYIRTNEKSQPVLLTHDQKEICLKLLIEKSHMSDEVKTKHIEQIQALHG